MASSSIPTQTVRPAVEAYLLGSVKYDVCLALQNRLVFEASGRRDGQISLILCEHPRILTVGRRGSHEHIYFDKRELVSRQLSVRWVNHGGGCMIHLPGQLAVYPIVPLDWHGFTVGEYANRLQAGLLETVQEICIRPRLDAPKYGVWGRSGQLASVGVAVKSWTSYHGAQINVCPAMDLFRWIRTDPTDRTPMSSLLVEHQKPVRMSGVREAVVRNLARAFGCQRYHLYTGHPLLPRIAAKEPATARVG